MPVTMENCAGMTLARELGHIFPGFLNLYMILERRSGENLQLNHMPPKIPDLGKIKQIIPPLSAEMHKGQAGKSSLRVVCLVVEERLIYSKRKRSCWYRWRFRGVSVTYVYSVTQVITRALIVSYSYTGAPYFSGISCMKLVMLPLLFHELCFIVVCLIIVSY